MNRLVPVGSITKTRRTCELVTARNPETPVVLEISDWIVAEFAADMDRINLQYAELDLAVSSDCIDLRPETEDA